MKFSYKFSNLFGTVYRGGDLIFSNDGNTVISPVGNKVGFPTLKNIFKMFMFSVDDV